MNKRPEFINNVDTNIMNRRVDRSLTQIFSFKGWDIRKLFHLELGLDLRVGFKFCEMQTILNDL